MFSRYERPIFNTILRMVRHRDDAQDLTQTVFVKAYEQLSSYDPRFKFYSWIYRIAVNESINHLRGRGRYEPLDGEWPSDRVGPEDALAAAELGRGVQDAMMTLSPDHRAAIVLKHFVGCSYQDIAEILGIREKVVKSRLFTARRILRDVLVARGIVR